MDQGDSHKVSGNGSSFGSEEENFEGMPFDIILEDGDEDELASNKRDSLIYDENVLSHKKAGDLIRRDSYSGSMLFADLPDISGKNTVNNPHQRNEAPLLPQGD